jgi:metallo-beta-lactamase class B
MMKKISLFLFAASLCISLFSQTTYEKIKISKDIELIQLTENAYVHVTYSEMPGFGRFASNGLIFSSNGKAFLFDTPVNDSLTKELVTYISGSLKLEIVGFVPNHWHIDCMGGLGYIHSIGIPSYANQKTIDIAKTKNLPIPTNGFKDSLILMLGDKEIKCYYPGAAHSMDNIVVWIPSEKILFPGCIVKEVKANTLGNTVDGDLNEYPQTVKKIIEKFYDAKIVIPGHGAYGDQKIIAHTLELLNKK